MIGTTNRTKAVEFKWGTSRGGETAGYTTCSCWIGGDRLGACSGGGYDLKGTAFAQAVCAIFQPALMTLAARAHGHYRRVPGKFYEVEGARGKTQKRPSYEPVKVRTPERRRFYGMTTYQNEKGKPERVSIDGACGFESVTRILEALGFSVEYVSGNSSRDTYLLHFPATIPGMAVD